MIGVFPTYNGGYFILTPSRMNYYRMFFYNHGQFDEWIAIKNVLTLWGDDE